jgi:transketolase
MSVSTAVDIAQLSINTIRTLSMDAVEAAKSGHPGTPMALAPITYTLWNEVLRFDPALPNWAGRDRFVLSCGHASMLLYSMLHLTGVKQFAHGKPTGELAVPLEHIKKFRQFGSRCPGHPEQHETSGVETTTGPLGQGCGNSVGMAIAQRWLAARYNKPGFNLFDYNMYVLCSDGDMMEGISTEAASIAGHLKLSNLCWIYDDNKITIEGHTDIAFSEDVGKRFEGLGWNVVRVADVTDLAALRKAYQVFHNTKDRPTMIIVRSIIAPGSPNKQNTHEAHGSPLGDAEIRLTKAAYGWPEDAQFLVPSEVVEHFANGIGKRGGKASGEWNKLFADYQKKHPELAAELAAMENHQLPSGWDSEIPTFPADAKGVASRVSGGKVLNAIAKRVPWLIGGSADLAPSTMTMLNFDGAGHFEANTAGANFHWGIREHGMTSALNGMALTNLRPFGATFFVFFDYLKPSLRLAAIMKKPIVLVLTHDSIGVGEDGPTHQPIEQLASARATPNCLVFRPGDANEVAECWRTAMLQTSRPSVMVLTRQNLPTYDRTKFAPAELTRRGGYILADAAGGKPDVILLGTGSELSVCMAAYETLTAEGVKARVVSLPCWEIFDEQDAAYREQVLPSSVTARVGVEAAIDQGWHKYLGSKGVFVGMNGFGASAPFSVLFKHFGITSEHVAAHAKKLLAK